MSYRPGLIEKVLLKLFKRFDIYKRVDGEEVLYLRRFHILRTKFFKFYVHHILRPDEDRHLHNHPWNFAVFMLSGGYNELIPAFKYFWKPGDSVKLIPRKPFSFRFMRGNQFHKISEVGFYPTWSLFFAFKTFQTWGFMDDRGFSPFNEYLSKYYPNQSPQSEDPTRRDPDSVIY